MIKCPIKRAEYLKLYRLKNRDKILASLKKSYYKNQEKRLLEKRNYYLNNKENIKNYHKNYRKKNLNKIKNYLLQNKEKISKYRKDYDKKYYLKYKNEIIDYKSKYYKNNKNTIIEKAKIRDRNRKKIDSLYKLSKNLRIRMKDFLKHKNLTKKYKLYEYIGCNLLDLKLHIEKQFVTGMSWDNYGRNGWHIDHIIPLSSAKTEDEIYKLNHYTNLQPLWAKDNLQKGAKIL